MERLFFLRRLNLEIFKLRKDRFRTEKRDFVSFRRRDLELALAILQERFGVDVNLSAHGDSRPKLEILSDFERFVVKEGVARKEFGAEHDGRMIHPLASEGDAPLNLPRGVVALSHRRERTVFKEEDFGAEDVDVGVFFEKRDLLFEAVGHGDVVGVHSCDIFTFRDANRAIQGARKAQILLVDKEFDARSGRVFAQDRRSRLVGGVVDDYQLEVLVGLTENRRDRRAEKFFRRVVNAHHRRDKRRVVYSFVFHRPHRPSHRKLKRRRIARRIFLGKKKKHNVLQNARCTARLIRYASPCIGNARYGVCAA